jgi:hypothetical protein
VVGGAAIAAPPACDDRTEKSTVDPLQYSIQVSPWGISRVPAKRAQLSSVNFQRTYVLGESYESVKEDAIHVLGKYLSHTELIMFNDLNRSVTFSTERLIPAVSSNRPRVMLLFSNPHPHSVYQGMFLSPNTRGLANPFWSVMRDAGWLSFSEGKRNPKELADICMTAEYQGPFELVFYCYYAFPTGLPEDIRRIFGDEYFSQSIKPEAVHEFVNTVQETAVDAVVAFNKEVFNLVSEVQVGRCVERLMEGELIQSQIGGIDRHVPTFLTFPTGWRYHKRYKQLRSASLDMIRSAIFGEANTSR